VQLGESSETSIDRKSSKAATMKQLAVQFLLQSLTSLAILCSASAADLQQQDIFVAGENGYHTYRIPSLIPTKKGALLAFCEGRKESKSDTGNIDIVLRRSTDNGTTWSPQQVIWDDGPNTCGNPCPVVDQKTGTIWLLLTHNLGEDHESEIKTKKAHGTRTVWISKSTDDGRHWSQPADITASVKDPNWNWYATGPGVGIQIQRGLHKGRLVVPCDYTQLMTSPVSDYGSHVIFSDDHGKTWQIGGMVHPGMNECQVVELSEPTGALLLSMRNHPKGSNRAQAVSVDGGATWSEPDRHSQLIDPTCQASILRYDWPARKHPGRILFSNPASERRENMTVRVSGDDGKTWPMARALYEKNSAYSCLAVLKDKRIGCLYERGEQNAYERITFARFSIEWLEGTK
jgi:sialidase-1